MAHIDKKALELYNLMNVIKSSAVLDYKVLLGSEFARLKINEANVIILLGEYGSCKMKELADRLKIAFSTMTGIIDKLVRLDYVVRNRTEKDRRVVMVMLTEKGRRLHLWLRDQSIKFYKFMLDFLDEDEQQRFLNLFRKITDNIMPASQGESE